MEQQNTGRQLKCMGYVSTIASRLILIRKRWWSCFDFFTCFIDHESLEMSSRKGDKRCLDMTSA